MNTTTKIGIGLAYLIIISSVGYLSYYEGVFDGLQKMCEGELGVDQDGIINCYSEEQIKEITQQQNVPTADHIFGGIID